MSIKRFLAYTLSILLLFNACQNKKNIESPSNSEAKHSSMEIKHAEWFKVDYYKAYKKITLINPWNSTVYWEYYIYKDAIAAYNKNKQSYLSKAGKSAVLSSTQIGIFSKLDLLSQIQFIDQIQYIYSPELKQLFKQKTISEIGEGTLLNVEKVILNHPSVVFTSGWEQIEPNYQKLITQNIPVAFSLDWQEKSPLARAEWIKFIAAFYDLEDDAVQIFDEIESKYIELKTLALNKHEAKTVLHGAPWSGTWYIAGGRSFMAQLYKDANANYLWSDDTSTGSLPLSFEAVFLKAKDADVWFAPTQNENLRQFMNDDPRFMEFKAFNNQAIYSNIILKEGEQANAFWEIGIVNPHWVLEDLITIIQPEALPNHHLKFYTKLRP